MNRLFIRIIVVVLIAIFALSALAPAFAEPSGERIVVTVDGDLSKGEALITRECIRVSSAAGNRMVVEDIVYNNGERVRREYRDTDGSLKLQEGFYKQQLVGGRINWRPTHRFVYAEDGQTIIDRQYFDADGNLIR